MRRRPILVRGTAAVLTGVLLASSAGCEARVYGSPDRRSEAPQLTMVAPRAPADATPAAVPNVAAASFDGLEARAREAVDEASEKGADLTFAVLDRETRQQVTVGGGELATASVAKLFIADDLLMRTRDLSPEDRASLEVMLRSSDDDAAEIFWNRGGGGEIIERVAERYGLTDTAPPERDGWWFTVTSARDLIRYYDMLLDGSGGLPPERANMIVNNLAQSTPYGIDGYPQRFGIPDGLPGEPVAVKQGWMPLIGNDWMHLSTGIVGPGRRFIMVVHSLQAADDATARATITEAVKTMFPDGRIR
ncbi:serine hydrolase [Mycobacterium sp. ACS4331]|uniref:serine hydrolase n=1 Tax=Mycobacterium sp. ACS4331 TaxID=1834121 RepID=UPI0007FE9047|nr:serine hydrolase [Mycobacterium sp. ACS4331]OBF17823.1 hypothetical protein A5727_11345 [Mycobacterium sp. ACS4331]